MTIQPFELVQPASMEEALASLADDPDLRPLAGGTALVILMKQGLLRPERLLSLRGIPGLGGTTWLEDGTLRIGATETIGNLERDPGVRSGLPGLAEACHVVANVRIRNLATVGGNLAHGDYQSDPPAMLTALGAQVEIRSAGGGRVLPIEEFQLSGYQTALEPGEMVVAVRVPPLPTGTVTSYTKFSSRSAEDRPCVGVGVRLRAEEGRCRELRVVVGAVSSTPVRVVAAEALAVGQPLTAELARAIGDEASRAVDPIPDLRGSVAYKRHVVGVLVRRALESIGDAA